MTYEEARDELDAIITKHEVDDEYVTITREQGYEALRVSIHSLKAWDKVKAEIGTIIDAIDYNMAFAEGMKGALVIIERYLQEVENG